MDGLITLIFIIVLFQVILMIGGVFEKILTVFGVPRDDKNINSGNKTKVIEFDLDEFNKEILKEPQKSVKSGVTEKEIVVFLRSKHVESRITNIPSNVLVFYFDEFVEEVLRNERQEDRFDENREYKIFYYNLRIDVSDFALSHPDVYKSIRIGDRLELFTNVLLGKIEVSIVIKNDDYFKEHGVSYNIGRFYCFKLHGNGIESHEKIEFDPIIHRNADVFSLARIQEIDYGARQIAIAVAYVYLKEKVVEHTEQLSSNADDFNPIEWCKEELSENLV